MKTIAKTFHLGNCLYSKYTHGGVAGDCFHPSGLSPALTTMEGGNRQPYVLIDEEDDDPLIGAERGGEVEKTSPRRQGSEIQEGKDSEAQPSPYIPDSDDLGDKGHKAFGI